MQNAFAGKEFCGTCGMVFGPIWKLGQVYRQLLAFSSSSDSFHLHQTSSHSLLSSSSYNKTIQYSDSDFSSYFSTIPSFLYFPHIHPCFLLMSLSSYTFFSLLFPHLSSQFFVSTVSFLLFLLFSILHSFNLRFSHCIGLTVHILSQ